MSAPKKKELTAQEMRSLGGKARAEKLTPERRKEIGQAANKARWLGHVPKKKVRKGT